MSDVQFSKKTRGQLCIHATPNYTHCRIVKINPKRDVTIEIWGPLTHTSENPHIAIFLLVTWAQVLESKRVWGMRCLDKSVCPPPQLTRTHFPMFLFQLFWAPMKWIHVTLGALNWASRTRTRAFLLSSWNIRKGSVLTGAPNRD